MAKADDISSLFDDLGEEVAEFDEDNPLVKVVTAWANEVVACMQAKLREWQKNNTGALSQGIRAVEAPRNLQDFRMEILSEAEYTSEVNDGRRPGTWPPRDNIRQWLRTKGLGSLNVGENLDAVAFLVSRKIYERGTEAAPFWDDCLTDSKIRELDQRIEAI
jgi:hypothetical protein